MLLLGALRGARPAGPLAVMTLVEAIAAVVCEPGVHTTDPVVLSATLQVLCMTGWHVLLSFEVLSHKLLSCVAVTCCCRMLLKHVAVACCCHTLLSLVGCHMSCCDMLLSQFAVTCCCHVSCYHMLLSHVAGTCCCHMFAVT